MPDLVSADDPEASFPVERRVTDALDRSAPWPGDRLRAQGRDREKASTHSQGDHGTLRRGDHPRDRPVQILGGPTPHLDSVVAEEPPFGADPQEARSVLHEAPHSGWVQAILGVEEPTKALLSAKAVRKAGDKNGKVEKKSPATGVTGV
jgi:hypothetical protein